MKTKWTVPIVAGAILVLLNGPAMAQPWGAGAGRGRGLNRGQGRGQGYARQGAAPRRAQGGPGAWCPLGAGRTGQGALCPLGLGQLGAREVLARRLGLTDEQVGKIRDILDKARSKTMASIREVLTDEQAKQLEQVRPGAMRPGRGARGPALQGDPAGRRLPRGAGQLASPRPRANPAGTGIEQMFDKADADGNGALTREEIRAFRQTMGRRP
ncbi:MAG: hypothetical protein KBE65_16620 [Phycisphaerae bacterium]|nr:hypothetical protein [Phycisphaerae bacterium]